MNWEDEGYLISKTKFRENANIINVFTKKYGKMNGIVYGGNSRKIRNFLQISNKIFVFYNVKNENKIGYFKTELIDPIAPKFFNDKKRTAALLSLTSLLNILLPVSQPYKNLYISLSKLIKNFNDNNWSLLYIYWELNLIRELGFDPNLNNLKLGTNIDLGIVDLEVDSIKYQVPNFLITNNISLEISDHIIKKGLIFTRSLMMNKFFIPNNLRYPKARIILENYFNRLATSKAK